MDAARRSIRSLYASSTSLNYSTTTMPAPATGSTSGHDDSSIDILGPSVSRCAEQRSRQAPTAPSAHSTALAFLLCVGSILNAISCAFVAVASIFTATSSAFNAVASIFEACATLLDTLGQRNYARGYSRSCFSPAARMRTLDLPTGSSSPLPHPIGKSTSAS